MATDAKQVLDGTEPEIEMFMVADRAEAINGKLYMMGGAWDEVTLADLTLPTVFSFAVSILVPWNGTNRQHAITIGLEDEDGGPVGVQATASFVAGRSPTAAPGQKTRVLLAVPVVSTPFPKFGTYTARASVGGSQRTVQFRVNRLGVPSMPVL